MVEVRPRSLARAGDMTPAGHHTYDSREVFDAKGLVLMPSCIDAHVHLREPGFEYKEDIASGLEAAARGGFGAVMCMMENINTETEKDSQGEPQWAIIEKAAFPWQHVRKMGEDMVATEIILPPGTCIGPYDLGALAAGGALEVPVFRRPRVSIIPSGSEIVPLVDAREEDLRAGRVLPEFNSLIFSAMITEAGGEAATLPVVPDDPEAIRAAIASAIATADMPVTVSMDERGSRASTSPSRKPP